MTSARHIVLGIGIALFAVGCQEDVASPSGLDEPFSIYGIINPRQEMQTVLVSPVENLLKPLTSSIDAVVTSRDRTSGREYVWKDSVAAGEPGQIDHIFWAGFRPDFGSKHFIQVTRSDGATSTVEVNVPPLVTVEYDDDGTRRMTVQILADENFRIMRADAVYNVRFYHNRGETLCEDFPSANYSFSHKGTERRINGGYQIEIDLNLNYETMRSYYRHDFGVRFFNPLFDGLALMHLTLSLTVGEEAWNPAGGEFDSHVLVQPGTLSNVQNGWGFVGGGYNQDNPLYPSASAVDDTWFFDYIMRRPDCSDYCSCGKDETKSH